MTNPQTELAKKIDKDVGNRFLIKFNGYFDWDTAEELMAFLEQELTLAADTAREDERARMLIIIENRRNMIFSCGYGDCDDSVSAELFEIEQALQQDTKE